MYQGDILRDVPLSSVDSDDNVIRVQYPYLVVLSQDCDLQQRDKRQDDAKNSYLNSFLPNILLLPAFSAEQLRDGKHLAEGFDVTQKRLDSDIWKTVVKNNNARYHFLRRDPNRQINDLVIDFKLYLTWPYKSFYSFYQRLYLASINELFREDLAHRFSSYLARVPCPELSSPSKPLNEGHLGLHPEE